jgi:hypothetical protein
MTMAQSRAESARRRGQEQELLLRAATGSGGEALAAYEAWRAHVDLDAAIDHETLALMPLLYGSLQKLGIDDSLSGRLKGICRRTWYENQTVLRGAREAVACLAEAGVECLLVGDLPIALTCYEGLSTRGIQRVDAVVMPAQAQLAEGRLRAAGWAAGSPLRDEEIAYNHVKRLTGPAGQVLALHWHFLEAASSEAADRAFWAAGEAFILDGSPARCLSPTGLLLHLLLGGGHAEKEPHSPIGSRSASSGSCRSCPATGRRFPSRRFGPCGKPGPTFPNRSTRWSSAAEAAGRSEWRSGVSTCSPTTSAATAEPDC